MGARFDVRDGSTVVVSVSHEDGTDPAESVQPGDVLVGVDRGTRVAGGDFHSYFEDSSFALEKMKRENKGEPSMFPVFEDSASDAIGRKISGFVRMEWVEPEYLFLESTENSRQIAIKEFRAKRAAERARELEEERLRARRKAQSSRWDMIELTLKQNDPAPHIQFVQQKIPVTVEKDVKSTRPQLKANDELVAVNENSVVNASNHEEVFKIIKEALWPKTLRWRRKKPLNAEDIKQQLGVLQVLSPKIASGCYVYRMADFGDFPPCEEIPLQIASDRILCEYQKDGTMGIGTNGTAMLAERGFCPFWDKIKFAQYANAKVLMVVNGNFEIPMLPSNERLKNETEIPVVMLSSKDGGFLMSVIDTLSDIQQQGRDVEVPIVRMGDPNICRYDEHVDDNDSDDDGTKVVPRCPDLTELSFSLDQKSHMLVFPRTRRARWDIVDTPKPVIKSKVGMLSYLGGDLQIWNGIEDVTMPYLIAMFGHQVPTDPRGVVVSKVDPSGCKHINELRGKEQYKPFVLVKRGVCQFTQKAEVAQKFGASVTIVMSHDDSLFRLPSAGPEAEKKLKNIATIMIRKSDSERLMAILDTSDNAVARFYPNTPETAVKI